MRLWPLFVLIAAVVILYVVMSSNDGKGSLVRFLGRLAGKTHDWLDRMAGDAPVTGNGLGTPNGPGTPNGAAKEAPEETEKTSEEAEGASEDDQG